MSKSEKLSQERSKRFEEGKLVCDLDGLYEYLDAVAEEALEEKAKTEKAQTKP
ncbi:MAG: hypothetical protein ACE5R6_15140 [Candidatus Heimdallarchaeota archaeon]